MSVSSSTLRRLAALNLAPEQMAGVLELLADQQEAEEARLRAQRERKARQRAGQSRDSHGTVTAASQTEDGPPPMVPLSLSPDPLPNPPLNPPQDPPPPTGASPRSKSSKPLRRLPEDWAVTESRRRKWNARGASDELIDSAAEDMRLWANGKGITRADWDATHDTFVKRDLETGGRRSNGGGSRAPPPEPQPSGITQVLHALQRRRDERSDDRQTIDLDLRDGRSH